MHLETRIEVLQRFTNEEWEALLSLTPYLPHPHRLIIVPDRSEDRRATIVRRLREGATRAEIARGLGVSPSLITRILNGTRR